MSIWCSMPAPDDTCEDRWESATPHCTCQNPPQPIEYNGSHVIPTENDTRTGGVDIAYAHKWVVPGADDNDDSLIPFLRFGVWTAKDPEGSTVILQPHHAKLIKDSLERWLQAIEDEGWET